LPRAAVKERLRGMFADVGTSMAAELLRDRRAAAAEESRIPRSIDRPSPGRRMIGSVTSSRQPGVAM
jgi:hypothetical protein